MKDRLILICLWIGMVSTFGTTILLALYCANFLKEGLNTLIFYSYLISIIPSSFLLKRLIKSEPPRVENIKNIESIGNVENVNGKDQEEIKTPLTPFEGSIKANGELEVKREQEPQEVKDVQKVREESFILKQLQDILIEVNRLKALLEDLEKMKVQESRR
ncbi:MAG: hypothetical protein RMJ31_00670 [Nitrososphaerota archaeon]|nr:hypothetical protein [Nitrososphaerales archaeon]MDW8044276.1 hypothetical protein [Nitrososphaerota archaeon]